MPESLPLSYNFSADLYGPFRKALELSKVHEGEHVLLHSDFGTNPHYAAAFMAAAMELGADVFQIVHPAKPEKAVVDAWVRADIVVDLSSGKHAYGNIMRIALDAGTRLYRIACPPDVMLRLFPTVEMKKRVEAGQKIMTEGKVMRITSPAGTDLTIYKEGREALGIYGLSDKPGRWDIWPSGMVCCAPIENKGEGVLVLDVGDMMLGLRQHVRERVYMEVRDGSIVSFKGGLEAELLEGWFKKFQSPTSYSFAHVGWGCNKKADWMHIGQDNECFYANMQIAFGSNVGIFPGAQTLGPSHIDFPCLNNAYWVDDVKIMEKGEFELDELKYKGE